MARKRETQLQPYPVKRIDDFSSGQNTAHPATIPDNALAVATNVMYTPEGKVIPRIGAAKRFSADFDADPVIGMSAYYKSDGTTRLVMAAGTSLYADLPKWTTTSSMPSLHNTAHPYTSPSHKPLKPYSHKGYSDFYLVYIMSISGTNRFPMHKYIFFCINMHELSFV